MVRKIRIVSQVAFFSLFLYLFFYATGNGVVQRLPSELFLQLNPLVTLLASIASRSILFILVPGTVVLTIATIFMGRVFCGYVCPLGAAVDFADRFIFAKMRFLKRRPPRTAHRLKYILLVFVAVLAVFGVLVPFFLDPVSITTRFMTLIINPALRVIGHQAVTLYGSGASLLSKSEFEPAELSPRLLSSIGALILFLVVFGGSLRDRRFWCQYVCPTGAFLGILSRYSFFRRRIRPEKCNACGVCAKRDCPTRAIDEQAPEKTSVAECILCGICADNARACSEVSFSKPVRSETVGPDLSRRHAVSGALGAAVLLPLTKTISVVGSDNELLRPPGSLPENAFLSRCLACGECMKVCPQNALRPCGLAYGLACFGTPQLVPRLGYCDPECNVCTFVCPTTAIRPVSMGDKPFVKIGTALVDPGRCIAWRGERNCAKCIQKCPYRAITEKTWGEDDDAPWGPSVDKKLCTGCGLCEQICPVEDTPAIRVHAYGERRISEGEVVSANRRKSIVRKRNKNKKRNEK